jgi:ABC-type multidrug transport system fused ATPase/permease subunit
MLPLEHQRAGTLFVGTIVNSFLEILGLAAVIPVISLVIEPTLIHSNKHLAKAFEFTEAIGVVTEKGFLILAAIGLIVAFLVKALFNLGLILTQTRFSQGVGHRLSGKMWTFHFSQSLERMRSSESGRVMEEINRWPLLFSSIFIVGSMRLINEIVVITLIASGLILYSPIVLLSVALLVSTGAIIIRNTTKNKLQVISNMRKNLMPQTSTAINNAIRGFIEVISFRASEAIKEDFLKKTAQLYRIDGNVQVLNLTPSKLYEVLAVTGVSAAIIVSLLQGESNEEFLNLLILMALSAYRIMPSLNRINGAVFNMRSNYFILNSIEEAMEDLKVAANGSQIKTLAIWPHTIIQLQNLSVKYETMSEAVFEDLTWTFETSQINAIVGPSGSGKSTLVNALLGLQPNSTGSVKVGKSVNELKDLGLTINTRDWLAQVGYLSQAPFLFGGTVEENLTMRIPGASLDVPLALALIKRLNLTSCLGPDPMAFQLLEGGTNLSGGQQQRLAVLRALIYNRSVLVLDEATSALDQKNRDVVFRLLRERAASGTTVLLITHDMELAVQCDTCLDLTKNTDIGG